MPSIEIDDLTKIGVIQDEPIFQLPPEAFSLATNMRMFADGMEKLKGWSPTMTQIDANSMLLIHADGVNGSTMFFDSGVNNFPVTTNGTAKVSTAQFKFGGASALFDGSAGCSIYVADNAALNPTGDFTLDFWAFPVSGNTQQLVSKRNAAFAPQYAFNINASGHLTVAVSSNGVTSDILNAVDLGVLPASTWTHIALVRFGGNYLSFVGGVLTNTTANANAPYQGTGVFSIGGRFDGTQNFIGNIDEVRFSNAARWGSGFTPSTVPYVPPLLDSPSMALYISSAAQPWWLWPSLTKIFVWDGTANTDITRTLGAYTATDADQWNGCILGGIPLLNDNSDSPQFWNSYSSGTKMQDLTNWPGAGSTPASTKAVVIRSFLTYLIALNMTESGVNAPHRVRWSSSASPGNLPSTWDYTDTTNDAGRNDLPDVDSGRILDGQVLGNQFFIYKESAVWRMGFIGQPYIFSFQVFLPTTGLLATRCIATTGPLPNSQVMHVFATQDDVCAHNGFMVESILTKRMKRYLAANLDATNFATSFMMPNPQYDEMWFCYPTNGNAHPNRAIIWNYKYNTLTEADGIDFQGFGIGTIFNSSGTIWNNAVGSWSADTAPWSASIRRRVVICNPTTKKMHLLDQGTTRDGISFLGTLQRTNMGVIGRKRSGEWLEDFTQRKMITAVWPKVQNGPINLRLGYNDLPNANPVWSSQLSFDPSTQVFVTGMFDGTNPGSARGVGIEFSSVNDFRVDGYKFDMSLLGKY